MFLDPKDRPGGEGRFCHSRGCYASPSVRVDFNGTEHADMTGEYCNGHAAPLLSIKRALECLGRLFR